jgi:hypothetical protein
VAKSRSSVSFFRQFAATFCSKWWHGCSVIYGNIMLVNSKHEWIYLSEQHYLLRPFIDPPVKS